MSERVRSSEILDVAAKHRNDRGGIIAMLHEIQSVCGFLPEEALRIVAEATGRSLVDVYGVATFYHSFSLRPRGRHLVSVCLGTACHVRAAPGVAGEFERQLGIRAGETTPDGEFTLETVNCLGACALGPIAVMDGTYFSNVGIPDVRSILDEAEEGPDRLAPPGKAVAEAPSLAVSAT